MPTPTFDGDNLLIILPAASPNIDVRADLYSEWKLWQLDTAGSRRYPPAWEAEEGGRATVENEVSGRNYRLRNDLGWRIRPAEEDAEVIFLGNLFPTDITLPIFVPTLGGFTVGKFIQRSSLALVEQTGSALTAAEKAQLARADELWKVFLNKAVTTDIGGGVKRIDFYDDDQSTIIDSVTISADGNQRTNP